ncbi:uncharacterized protein BDV17DRAFT_234775 [Aspergillus undulatus]|uniref:uncharacterized protein n=1 Tax=Aspergillus undulatus TaxID=1810928 RepID=UPI003CCD5F2C
MQHTYIEAVRNHKAANITSPTSTTFSKDEEPQKVVITRSLPAALWSCAIHLLPIAVSSTIIALNIRGTYLGADLMSPVKSETINLMLFQIAAKAHEITIVASLGVIVLQYIRHELLFGDGLPLGLLGSGLAFNHLEYFFGKEFYGSLKYVAGRGNKLRKIALIFVVVVAGILATFAGPASAVLLVPKSQDWSAGGTEFYLDGTEDEFWPSDLSGDLSGLRQVCGQVNSTHLAVCPGGGYHSLWNHWGTLNSSIFQTQTVRPYAKELSGSYFYWPISSPSSMLPPLYALGDNQPEPNGKTTLTQPHAASAAILQRLAEDWWEALSVQKGLTANQVDDRTASAAFRNAISVVRCAAPERLYANETTVHFPSIIGRFDFGDVLPLEVETLNPNRTDHLRFQWVHLPDNFGTASVGGLFETPWETSGPGQSSRAVVGCTVQAGWVPATVYTDKYTFWTGWYPWNILFGDRTPAFNQASTEQINGRIAFGNKWLDLLTPPAPITTPDTPSWRPSTMESILLNAGTTAERHTSNRTDPAALNTWLAGDTSSWQKVSLIESIICSVVVDGLSRTGSHRVFNFNTSGPGPGWSIKNYKPLPGFSNLVLNDENAVQPPSVNPTDYITLKAELQISGFSLQSSLATYLAMSVLLIHMLMATIHIIYVLIKRHTSGSWSTVGELIALSQNSQPAFDVLPNTGGGIKRSRTYAQVAKIRALASSLAPKEAGGRIELLFDGPLDPLGSECERTGPGRELRRLRNSLLRHPATWPRHRTQDGDQDGWGLSGSTERLVPGFLQGGRETASQVRLDNRYG